MPASTSLQSRIMAFESLGTTTTAPKAMTNPLEEPISPTANLRLYSPMAPEAARSPSRSPSPDPPGLGTKTSLIDLKDWVVDDGPSPPMLLPPRPQSAKPRTSAVGAMSSPHPTSRIPSASSTPLITLDTPPSPQKQARAPPLPPRKPSYTSLRSASSDSSSSAARAIAGPPATLRPNDSLSPGDPHIYPPPDRPRNGHAQASSISSFHSVSLSSDGGGEPNSPNTTTTSPPDPRDADAESIDSFDHVSATSVASTYEWPRPLPRGVPALPPRSNVGSPRMPTSPTLSGGGRTPTIPTLPYVPRRIPPPPPPSGPGTRSPPASSRASVASHSDRSSILSTGTASTSRTSVSAQSTAAPQPSKPESRQLARPTPVPAPARARYETVFVANVLARKGKNDGQKQSQSRKGWRGLSVDLITMESTGTVEEVGTDATLDGATVATLWSSSRLPKHKLKAIWNGCDTSYRGCLDREAFVKGMWRIDEELRRAQFSRQAEKASVPSGPYLVRQLKRSNTSLALT